MKIVVTGAGGFIGKNLAVRLAERQSDEMLPVTRETTTEQLREVLGAADCVIHLAGANRPPEISDFQRSNTEFTKTLCEILQSTGRNTPIAFASSIQAELDNAYGASKFEAEKALDAYARQGSAGVGIFRLPNVFGKWCRPNYNSVVATFCHNIARGIPLRIDDPTVALKLAYVDDVCEALLKFADSPGSGRQFLDVQPTYNISVGELATQIRAFQGVRESLFTEPVGRGLVRALYSTYMSTLAPDQFSYPLVKHGDHRGVFVEMLKTKDCGQFSYFTAHPGVTRGGHYHHTKSEKFLVLQGHAHFKFRHVATGGTHTIDTSGEAPQIVETIPGWAHDISNVGTDLLVVMLWANEVFDRDKPDTYAARL